MKHVVDLDLNQSHEEVPGWFLFFDSKRVGFLPAGLQEGWKSSSTHMPHAFTRMSIWQLDVHQTW